MAQATFIRMDFQGTEAETRAVMETLRSYLTPQPMAQTVSFNIEHKPTPPPAPARAIAAPKVKRAKMARKVRVERDEPAEQPAPIKRRGRPPKSAAVAPVAARSGGDDEGDEPQNMTKMGELIFNLINKRGPMLIADIAAALECRGAAVGISVARSTFLEKDDDTGLVSIRR